LHHHAVKSVAGLDRPAPAPSPTARHTADLEPPSGARSGIVTGRGGCGGGSTRVFCCLFPLSPPVLIPYSQTGRLPATLPPSLSRPASRPWRGAAGFYRQTPEPVRLRRRRVGRARLGGSHNIEAGGPTAPVTKREGTIVASVTPSSDVPHLRSSHALLHRPLTAKAEMFIEGAV
jgi:hypothetical protein